MLRTGSKLRLKAPLRPLLVLMLMYLSALHQKDQPLEKDLELQRAVVRDQAVVLVRPKAQDQVQPKDQLVLMSLLQSQLMVHFQVELSKC
jgi:hypothetical protein